MYLILNGVLIFNFRVKCITGGTYNFALNYKIKKILRFFRKLILNITLFFKCNTFQKNNFLSSGINALQTLKITRKKYKIERWAGRIIGQPIKER